MIHARCGIAALTTSERRRARCEACVAGRERQRFVHASVNVLVGMYHVTTASLYRY